MLYPPVTSELGCFCGNNYSSPQDLEEHRKARGHFPSHRCTTLCKHPVPTPNKGPAQVCGGCGKTCNSPDIFRDHAIATGHCFCYDCDLTFPNRHSWDEHRKSAKHASEFRCSDCNISFQDFHALVAHIESRAHRKPLLRPKMPPHDKDRTIMSSTSRTQCTKCNRTFSCSKSLQQHYDSVKHKPIGQLKCPMGANCKGNFTSPSALLHHLESGGCLSGMHRGKIFQLVQSCDLDIISSQSPSLSVASSSALSPRSCSPSTAGTESWTAISDNESEWSMLTPSPSSHGSSAQDSLEQWSLLEEHGSVQLGEDSSIVASTILQCPICPEKRAAFSTLHSLQQHMNSPAHSPKIYQCPPPPTLSSRNGEITSRRAVQFFATLGGLCQHLESSSTSCRGEEKNLLLGLHLLLSFKNTVGSSKQAGSVMGKKIR